MTMQPGATNPEQIVIDQDDLIDEHQINESEAQLIRPSLLPVSEINMHSKSKNLRSEEDEFIDEEKRSAKESKRSEMAIISKEVQAINKIYETQVIIRK